MCQQLVWNGKSVLIKCCAPLKSPEQVHYALITHLHRNLHAVSKRKEDMLYDHVRTWCACMHACVLYNHTCTLIQMFDNGSEMETLAYINVQHPGLSWFKAYLWI